MTSTRTKKLSIVTPLYNEEANVVELCSRISHTMESLPFDYEHICIDNCSSDQTVEILKKIALQDKHVKIIVNTRNFGYIRSSFYGLLQSSGDAVVLIASDLQDPPELIRNLAEKWEEGYKTVLATKSESEEVFLLFFLRRLYYKIIGRISEVPLIQNATGSGLFDRTVIEILRKIDDPYPYFRGLVCEIGFPIATVPFKQPRRKGGMTSQNFYSLYDVVMLGFVKHSKVPLRIMSMAGFLISGLSFIVATCYLIAKLLFWDYFVLWTAPILIGIFLFGGLQMLFIGLLGEYIGQILTQVRNLPLVIERERINF